MNALNSPYVTFGGSYPGNLAGWIRVKYPHLTIGSVASSAPVNAVTDFYAYMDVGADVSFSIFFFPFPSRIYSFSFPILFQTKTAIYFTLHFFLFFVLGNHLSLKISQGRCRCLGLLRRVALSLRPRTSRKRHCQQGPTGRLCHVEERLSALR